MTYQLLTDFRAFKKGEYISHIEYKRLPEHIQKHCKEVKSEAPKTATKTKPAVEPKIADIPVTATWNFEKEI